MSRCEFIYVAGPMSRGDLVQHIRGAVFVADQIYAAGGQAFLPQLSVLYQLVSPRSYEEWMTTDFRWIDRCDAVLRLEGESLGADREMKYAKQIGRRIFNNVEDCVLAIRCND